MERKVMKKKGFTLVELLVVIAIIAMLLAILMPALGKVRQLAQRMVCSTNLAGIGKAMLVYTNDDKYESYPIAGPSGTMWDSGSTTAEGECTWDWSKKDMPGTTGNPISGTPYSTISACLYLLVKYADVSPDNFTCPGSEEKKFELSNYNTTAQTPAPTITDVWDFGQKDAPGEKTAGLRGRGHNSYAYQLPFTTAATGTGNTCFPITTTSNPAKAVAADRNPFFDKTRVSGKAAVAPTPSSGATDDPGHYNWVTTTGIDKSILYVGNATPHQKEGQSVLYADGHTKFEKGANCGVESDNIYTPWNYSETGTTTDAIGKKKQVGMASYTTSPVPHGKTGALDIWAQDAEDNFLVNDYN